MELALVIVVVAPLPHDRGSTEPIEKRGTAGVAEDCFEKALLPRFGRRWVQTPGV